MVYTRVMWRVDIELIAGWLSSLDVDSREQVVAASYWKIAARNSADPSSTP
ncbi:hypothetical protein [Rothia koreensis]|uniref:hypothetical protein n=1 Tax=Rothia koreensis TaxID=592378 RepID=UPI00193112BC|nr:hypothetical protein [Rothia koreensis]